MAQCRVPLLAGPTFLAQPHQRGQGETIRVCASIVGSSKEVTFFLNATTSYKNVETFPRNKNLSCLKSLLVTGRWDMNSLLPPIQSCSSTFWAWSCIASNFDEGWREDHKHKTMDRPFKPKQGTVSQVLLELVVDYVDSARRALSRDNFSPCNRGLTQKTITKTKGVPIVSTQRVRPLLQTQKVNNVWNNAFDLLVWNSTQPSIHG